MRLWFCITTGIMAARAVDDYLATRRTLLLWITPLALIDLYLLLSHIL